MVYGRRCAQAPALQALARNASPAGRRGRRWFLCRAAGDGVYIVVPYLLGLVVDAGARRGRRQPLAGVAGVLGAVAVSWRCLLPRATRRKVRDGVRVAKVCLLCSGGVTSQGPPVCRLPTIGALSCLTGASYGSSDPWLLLTSGSPTRTGRAKPVVSDALTCTIRLPTAVAQTLALSGAAGQLLRRPGRCRDRRSSQARPLSTATRCDPQPRSLAHRFFHLVRGPVRSFTTRPPQAPARALQTRECRVGDARRRRRLRRVHARHLNEIRVQR